MYFLLVSTLFIVSIKFIQDLISVDQQKNGENHLIIKEHRNNDGYFIMFFGYLLYRLTVRTYWGLYCFDSSYIGIFEGKAKSRAFSGVVQLLRTQYESLSKFELLVVAGYKDVPLNKFQDDKGSHCYFEACYYFGILRRSSEYCFLALY